MRLLARTLLAGALAAVVAPTRAVAQAADTDPQAVVFLPLTERGAGAPGADTVDDLVVLDGLPRQSDYREILEVLATKRPSAVLRFDPAKLEPVFEKLARSRPGNVIVVLEPAALDVNFHFEFLERAARLDADPFVDFAFGYMTGATAAEAVTFCKGSIGAHKKKLPRSVLEFGPSSRPAEPQRSPHGWAKKFDLTRYSHAEDASDVAERLTKIAKGVGVLKAWGHGMPDGVDHGMSGRSLRDSDLDLYPALYFSGPCYCGVPSAWYGNERGKIARKAVAPEDSFVLALIESRAAGIFAGLDPDRGETNSHEFEHLLLTGEALGKASKSTYDDAVVAYRRDELVLPRYEPGGRDPHRNIADTMIAGGACRALFGDPTLQPFDVAGDDPFAVKSKWRKKELVVTWRGGDDLGKYWTPVDVFRAQGRWTHRIRFRLEVPADKARSLRSFAVTSVTKDGDDLEFCFPTAAVELWGGKARIHGLIVFPVDPQNRALWGGKEYAAEFRFGR